MCECNTNFTSFFLNVITEFQFTMIVAVLSTRCQTNPTNAFQFETVNCSGDLIAHDDHKELKHLK